MLLRGNREATYDVILQPLEQRRPYPRRPVRRCQPWTQWLPKNKSGEPLARRLYRRQKLALSEVIGLPLSKRSGERNLIEHRTDGTDAFEILYIGAEKFTFHDTFSLSMSGVL